MAPQHLRIGFLAPQLSRATNVVGTIYFGLLLFFFWRTIIITVMVDWRLPLDADTVEWDTRVRICACAWACLYAYVCGCAYVSPHPNNAP